MLMKGENVETLVLDNTKSKLLQVVSILTIIFSSIGYIANWVFIAATQNSVTVWDIMPSILMVLELCAGIYGVSYCREADKMLICLILGIIWLASYVAMSFVLIAALIYWAIMAFNNEVFIRVLIGIITGGILGAAIGAVLPTLYLIAVCKFMKKDKTAVNC